MDSKIKQAFDKSAIPFKKDVDVLVLGAGVMGKRHIRSLLEISQKVLEPRYGVTLHVSAVDCDDACLQALPETVKKFKSLDDALVFQALDVALMAFNDDQHAVAFKKLFAACSEVKAVLSEKPLTETLAEAKEIEPELQKRYLSMNTVINFSPVFDRIQELMPELTKKYGALNLTGFEAVWGKNRTADTRPSIGIPSESVHALSIVTDMFDQNELVLEKGKAVAGYLSTKATDVIYEMESDFVSRKTGVKMRFHTSYVFFEQERRVTAYYRTQDNNAVVFEMEFDVKVNGQNKDSLKVYEIDGKTGTLKLIVDEYPDNVVNGVEPGLLKNDRITAFNSLSLLNFLPSVPPLEPNVTKRLGMLDTALEIQGMIEQINLANPLLDVTKLDADPANLHRPKYPRLMATDDKSRLERLKVLLPKAPLPSVQKRPVL